MKYRWQQKAEQPSHTDDWLMTYADMITLLLCFFVVFVIVSATKKDTAHVAQPPYKETAEPIPQQDTKIQMQLPGVFSDNLPFHKIGPADFSDVESLASPPANKTPTEVVEAPATSPPALLVTPEVIKKADPLPAPDVVDVAPIQPPKTIESAKLAADSNFEQKGDRITTLETNSAALFDSGSSTITEAGAAILQKVAIDLKSDRFKNYQITVEGHTDDTPISTPQFPSNWELSTARASAVVHFFLGMGIPASKLRAAGYADTFPKVPNRDANGNSIPFNQAQNRRVVIKLEKIERAQ